MPKSVLFFFVILVLSLSLSCKLKKNGGAKIKTTSDRIREYSYTVESAIHIPINNDVIYISYLLDLERRLQDNKTKSISYKEQEMILNSTDLFLETYEREYGHYYKLIKADGSINPAALKSWISLQLRLMTGVLKEYGLEITLHRLIDYTPGKIVEMDDLLGPMMIVDYKAEVYGIRQLRDASFRNPDQNPLSVGTVLQVPKDVISPYFITMGNVFKKFLHDSYKLLPDITKMRNLVHAQSLISKTAHNDWRNPCYEPDGDHVSPQNFYYYYNPLLDGCPKLSGGLSLKILETKEKRLKRTYPEYHRLFNDGKVSFLIYLTHTEKVEVYHIKKHFFKFLRQSGFILDESQSRPGKKILRKKVNDQIEFLLTVAVAHESDIVARETFQEGFKENEIIVYDGHAGYGININNHFTDIGLYPKNKYQILFLNGCSTYKYGATSVLSSKALVDNDFLYHNIDLISTFGVVTTIYQELFLIEAFNEAANIFIENKWDRESIELFEQKYSWLGIISGINETTKEKNEGEFDNYLVSGEINNDYKPGKTTYEDGTAHVESTDSLWEAVINKELDEAVRARALGQYISISKFSNESELKKLIEQVRGACRQFRDKQPLWDVLNVITCNISQLKAWNKIVLEGKFEFSKGEHIVFHSNGKVVSGRSHKKFKVKIFGRDVTVGGDLISFYEDGQLQVAKVMEEVNIRDNMTTVKDETVQFFNNGNLSFISLKPFDVEILGQKLKLDYITQFYQNGSLKSARLFNDFVLNSKITLLKNDQIIFDPDGRILSAGSVKPGSQIVLNGSKSVKIAKSIRLYDNGKPYEVFLDEDFQLNDTFNIPKGVTIKINRQGFVVSISGWNEPQIVKTSIGNIFTRHPIRLFEDGTVDKIIPTKEVTLPSGIKIEEGNILDFYPGGALEKYNPKNPIELDDYSLADYAITLYKDGQIKLAHLAKGEKVKGIRDIEFSGSVRFSKGNQIIAGNVTKNITLNELNLKPGNYVSFYTDGPVRRIETGNVNLNIGQIARKLNISMSSENCEEYGHVGFDLNGKVIEILCDKMMQYNGFTGGYFGLRTSGGIYSSDNLSDKDVNGVKCADGSRMFFDQQGKIVGCTVDESYIHDNFDYMSFLMDYGAYYFVDTNNVPISIVQKQSRQKLYDLYDIPYSILEDHLYERVSYFKDYLY